MGVVWRQNKFVLSAEKKLFTTEDAEEKHGFSSAPLASGMFKSKASENYLRKRFDSGYNPTLSTF